MISNENQFNILLNYQSIMLLLNKKIMF